MDKNTEILRQLKRLELSDPDKSLFYSWDSLSSHIQQYFILWCRKYMQVDHAKCFGGWGFGWSKYHEHYIEFLQNKQKFLQDRDML